MAYNGFLPSQGFPVTNNIIINGSQNGTVQNMPIMGDFLAVQSQPEYQQLLSDQWHERQEQLNRHHQQQKKLRLRLAQQQQQQQQQQQYHQQQPLSQPQLQPQLQLQLQHQPLLRHQPLPDNTTVNLSKAVQGTVTLEGRPLAYWIEERKYQPSRQDWRAVTGEWVLKHHERKVTFLTARRKARYLARGDIVRGGAVDPAAMTGAVPAAPAEPVAVLREEIAVDDNEDGPAGAPLEDEEMADGTVEDVDAAAPAEPEAVTQRETAVDDNEDVTAGTPLEDEEMGDETVEDAAADAPAAGPDVAMEEAPEIAAAEETSVADGRIAIAGEQDGTPVAGSLVEVADEKDSASLMAELFGDAGEEDDGPEPVTPPQVGVAPLPSWFTEYVSEFGKQQAESTLHDGCGGVL